MSSKSGGYDARSSQDRGRGGHGKDHLKPSEKSAEISCENRVEKVKLCEISFKTI